MKDKTDQYIVQKLKNLTVLKNAFLKKFEQYKDVVGAASEDMDSDKLEELNFELLLVDADVKFASSEVVSLYTMYKKLEEELPAEYIEIIKENKDLKNVISDELYTFRVEDGDIHEREPGIVQSKLKLTRSSDVYNKFKDKLSSE